MGERKEVSSGTAERLTSATGHGAGREASAEQTSTRTPEERATGKARATGKDRKTRADETPRRTASKTTTKMRKKAASAGTSSSEKLAVRSGKAGGVKDTETPPVVEGKSETVADPNQTQAAPRAAGRGGRGEAKSGFKAARNTESDKRPKAGVPADSTARPNTLVPTNGIHVTERRLKRTAHHNRTIMFLIAATLLGILILGEQTEPPDMTAFKQQIAAGQTGNARARSIQPRESAAPGKTDPAPEARTGARAWELDGEELVEMERMLARLDLEPSTVDGIVDRRTTLAIRLYQQIAGLPIDGEPSRALLSDLREVVKIIEDGG